MGTQRTVSPLPGEKKGKSSRTELWGGKRKREEKEGSARFDSFHSVLKAFDRGKNKCT